MKPEAQGGHGHGHSHGHGAGPGPGVGRSPGRSAWRAPALQALALQGLALLALSIFFPLLQHLTGWQASVAVAALLQGLVAALLTRWRGLAVWWVWIQFLFPPALLVAHALRLPPSVFLAAFLFFLALYWSAFRTQVPYYPSRREVWRVVAGLLPQGRPLRIADIGSGFGGLVLDLAARRPDCAVVGIELAPLPWLVSALRAKVGGGAACFVRGDYERLDLGGFDVVFAYLSPAAMPALWAKAKAEMLPGSLLLSYEFGIPGVPADMDIACRPDGPVLHLWRN